ncbi:MAG: type III-A CRISPR-associated RAMP protein Csm5 [Candidatus Riflebacteria bacterium]|nr:type III-A CRISPR-associated RAMP protein Csm5 [Candidatus Riflebacteria bacterium]
MTKNYQIKLTTLTPVHIGSGLSYEPTQFFIDNERCLNLFNTSELLDKLDEKQLQEFTKICLDMNYVGMFRFFREKFPASLQCRKVRVAKDIAADYERVLAMGSQGNQVINQLELKRTIFNDFQNTAYIPGSSLKGSLKTAWMSKAAVDKRVTNMRNIRDCENAVLEGSFSSDPFRFVKISDLFPGEAGGRLAKTMVLYATNHRKNPDRQADKSSLTVAFEVIMPGNEFVGMANLEQPKGLKSVAKMPAVVDLEALAKASEGHYFKKLQQEEEMLKKLGCQPGLVDKVREKSGDKLFKTVFPLRVGHHSGAEFLTLDGNRQIKVKKGRQYEIADSATTVWLASASKRPKTLNDLAPFGWILLEFLEG